MNTMDYVTRLIIDGAVAIPKLLTDAELASMRAGFERRAAELGKRNLNWDEIREVPELMSWILHPRLMEIVNAYCGHFRQQAVFANCSGIRDVYGPNEKRDFKPFDPTPHNLRYGSVGWHDDVVGMRTPDARMMDISLTTLVYLDETFPHSGAYCSAVGSHHLAAASPDHKPILATPELVLDHCELRPLPVKAGGVVIHRSHEWHGVVPVGQMRRIMLQTFTSREVYDLQVGHTQVSDATKKLIPADRHGQLCWYSAAATR